MYKGLSIEQASQIHVFKYHELQRINLQTWLNVLDLATQ